MQYMPPVLLEHAKEVRDDGSVIEIVVWELPEPLSPSTHPYKYRLFFGAGDVSRVPMTTSAVRAITGTLVRRKRTTPSRRLTSCSTILSVTSQTGADL